ncbi:MAG: NAD(P)-dependent oxidoreductase [Solirubrobacterales bacterium]
MLVVDPLHPAALAELRDRFDLQVAFAPGESRLRALIADADVLVMRSGIDLNAAVIAEATRLKVVARAGVGIDNIDFDAARAAGVKVFNVPDRSSNAVAEFVFGLALAIARKIALADSQVRSDVWRKAELAGLELRGSTIGLVGLGKIGSRVAQLANAFGLRVLATVGDPSPGRAEQLAAAGVELVELSQLLSAADLCCLALPLNERTAGMIGANELELMRREAFLVNVSRAELVDTGALLGALRDRRIDGAAIDVLHKADCRLFSELDNVVLTPHIGAMTDAAQASIGREVVRRIAIGLDGKEIPDRLC